MKKFMKQGIVTALVLAMTVVMFTGCGNNDTKTASTKDSLEGAIGEKTLEYQGYLGYGYDVVNGDYYNVEGVEGSGCVIDMDSLAAAGYVREDKKVNKTSLNFFSAKTIDEFYGSFTKKFSGMADLGFLGILKENNLVEKELCYENQYLVFSNCQVKTKRELINGATPKLLGKYLTEEFKDDVDELSGKELLDKYGSYVLTDIYLGGRMSVLFYLKNIGEFTYEELSAAMAGYFEKEGVEPEDNDINVSGITAKRLKLATTYIESKARIAIRSYGGDVSVNPNNVGKALSSFADWQKSVKDGGDVFMDANSGVPIWKLAATVNADKAKEIENAFNGIEEKAVETVSGAALK